MPIIWKPNGSLNISTDPSFLPEEVDGSTIYSEAMQRLKNLRVDEDGVVKTRDGSAKINSTALAQTAINHIAEQAGIRYGFAGTAIYRNESSIATGLTNAAWKTLLYNAYNSVVDNIFALNGTDRKRIDGSSVYEWGIDPPTEVPVLAVGVLGGLTGDYNVKYTYCRKEGSTVVCESDPSPAATSAQTLSSESLSVTWTASSDSQVTHVRVYRTSAGGAAYYLDQDVAIGTLTLDTDTADTALGTEVATDHDRPPLGTFVLGPSYNGTCFILKDNLLYYCKPKQPEYWPVAYYIEVSPTQFPLQCMVFYNGQPYVLSKQRIYYISGSGHTTFFPWPVDSVTGCRNANAAVAVKGYGIFHVGSDGIYLYGSTDQKVTQADFERLFRGETVNGVPGISDIDNCWLTFFRNKLYFGYTSSGYTYPTNVLVFDLTNEKRFYYTWGQEIRTVAIDEYNSRLLAGDNSGFIWHIEDVDETDDGGTAVAWEIESKDFTLSTRAHFPRYVKYDIDASDNGCSATGEILLDGVSHQSHTITGNRQTKKRLVTTGNGERSSIKISGSGVVAIHQVEVE